MISAEVPTRREGKHLRLIRATAGPNRQLEDAPDDRPCTGSRYKDSEKTLNLADGVPIVTFKLARPQALLVAGAKVGW